MTDHSARTRAKRRNALTGTGPTSPDGKQRTAQNARQHGLSLLLASEPGLMRWAQVYGGKPVTAEGKNALEERYIAHASLRVDLRITWRTLLATSRDDRRNEKSRPPGAAIPGSASKE
jgi:sugar transferase EpsL